MDLIIYLIRGEGVVSQLKPAALWDGVFTNERWLKIEKVLIKGSSLISYQGLVGNI